MCRSVCSLRRCLTVLGATVVGVALAASPALATTPPTVTTGAATNVTATSATLNGTVTGDTSGITFEQFEYWASGDPCTQLNPRTCPVVAATGGPSNPSAQISGLTPDTLYNFVLIVQAPSQSLAGNVATFTTLSVAPPPVATGGSASTDVSHALGVSGATITSVLAAGGYTETVQVPDPGTLTITWVPAGATIASAKPVVIAKVTKTFSRAGSSKIKIKLTAKGKALLKKSKHLKLTAVGTFKPHTGSTVTKHKTFKLKKS